MRACYCLSVLPFPNPWVTSFLPVATREHPFINEPMRRLTPDWLFSRTSSLSKSFPVRCVIGERTRQGTCWRWTWLWLRSCFNAASIFEAIGHAIKFNFPSQPTEEMFYIKSRQNTCASDEVICYFHLSFSQWSPFSPVHDSYSSFYHKKSLMLMHLEAWSPAFQGFLCDSYVTFHFDTANCSHLLPGTWFMDVWQMKRKAVCEWMGA